MGFFDGFAGPAVAGLAGLAGGILANDANAAQADRNRDFQASMSNTAHQREVNDLRAAGLNPMLSVNAGSSTPAGGVGAPMQNALGAGASTAMDAMRLKQDMAESASKIGLNAASTQAQGASAMRDTATAKQAEATTTALQSQLGAIKKEAGLRESQADIDKKMQTFDNTTKRIQSVMGIGSSAVDLMKPFNLLPKGGSGIKPWQGQMKDGTIYNKGTGEIVNP